MVVAFTGTRRGMTPAQFERVSSVVRHLVASERLRHVHHGACEGADRDFHKIAREHRLYQHLHPSNTEQYDWAEYEYKRSPGEIDLADIQTPLVRNHGMVDLSERLIATPASMKEVQRSGTWATIRYAKQKLIPVYLCWPDGQLTVWHP